MIYRTTIQKLLKYPKNLNTIKNNQHTITIILKKSQTKIKDLLLNLL